MKSYKISEEKLKEIWKDWHNNVIDNCCEYSYHTSWEDFLKEMEIIEIEKKEVTVTEDYFIT